MDKPLRILMIVHAHWMREVGVARIPLELAEEFRKLGYIVEKFSYEDAFPNPQSRFEELTCNFQARAEEFVKQNAHRFDVIDACEADLPFSKRRLGFNGLLVARSSGLRHFYEEAEEIYGLRKTKVSIKAMIRQFISYPFYRRWHNYSVPSLKESDLIILYNYDELNYVSNVMDMGSKSVIISLGLSDSRRDAFAQAIRPAHERLKNKEVAFIGCWSARKGSWDWPDIIKRVKSRIPQARFKFLGTGFKEKEVLKDLHLTAGEGVKIIPHFRSEELPGLLAESTVGAFPSYIEGFGFAVLEKLACGLPVVSYDVPGVREMMRHFDNPMMVKPGDIADFADRLVNLLSLDDESYSHLSQRCVEISQKFAWPEIAAQTIKTYSEFLKKKSEIRISVALITYNRPESLRRCLKSLRAQNAQPWEVVISDDSDANLASEIEKIAKEWSCVYIRGPRRGIYANCNHAALACRGTHIRFMNDDHAFPEGHMEQCLQAVYSDPCSIWTTGEVGFVDGRYYARIETAGQLSASGWPGPFKDKNDNWAISTGSNIFPRKVFDRGYRLVEDYSCGPIYLEFGAFLYYHGFRSRCIDGAFVEHYADEAAITRFCVEKDFLESALYNSLCYNLYFRPNFLLALRYICSFLIRSHFSWHLVSSLPGIIYRVMQRWSRKKADNEY